MPPDVIETDQTVTFRSDGTMETPEPASPIIVSPENVYDLYPNMSRLSRFFSSTDMYVSDDSQPLVVDFITKLDETVPYRKKVDFEDGIYKMIRASGVVGRRMNKYPKAVHLARKLREYAGNGYSPSAGDDKSAHTKLTEIFQKHRDKRDGWGFSSIGVHIPLKMWGIQFGYPVPRNIHRNHCEHETWDDYYQSVMETIEEEVAPIVEEIRAEMMRAVVGRTIHADMTSGVVNWIERFGDEQGAYKVRSASWSKFLRTMRHKFGMNFTDEEIQQFSEAAGVVLRPPEYEIEIDDGYAIVDTYREEYFGSCLHNSPAVSLFAKQRPGTVSIMRCIDKESGALAGRALLWHKVKNIETNKMVTVLDRIYPSDGGQHITAMIKYAEKRGWFYKEEQSIRSPVSGGNPRMKVHLQDIGAYPYMDTFHFVMNDGPEDDGTFYLYNYSSRSHSVPMHHTDNMNPWTEEFDEDYAYCAFCDDQHHIDNMYGTEEGIVCEYCYNEYFGETVYGDIVYIDNGDWIIPTNLEYWGLYASVGDCVYNDITGEDYYIGTTIPRFVRNYQEPILVEYGQGEGLYFMPEDVYVDVDGDTWWIEDEERPIDDNDRLDEE